jgi:hypothetical protein
VGYVPFAVRRSCGKGNWPVAFAGVGVVSQLSLVVPPLDELLLLTPEELLLELPPLPLELLLPPDPDELEPELELDEALPPELLPDGPVSPPGGAVDEAQPAYKNPTIREESE